LVNNAAQTIQYPEEYYLPLIRKEQLLMLENKDKKLLKPIEFSKTKQGLDLDLLASQSKSLPNRFGQPVDLRTKTSWNSTLEDISTFELLEVNLINHISPYLLIQKLTPLMRQSEFEERFIINVSSSEGQFSYGNKTIHHPHTNMTKAALNMLTRTSAEEYQRYGIFMNSVDVGWISTGAHEEKRKKQFESGYIPPLDSVDGASRILYPMREAIEKKNYLYGKLLKNYEVVDW
jgi:NAD(P)-dependent dehydrogenase (short-subunit alcohol dehydrogenase family)